MDDPHVILGVDRHPGRPSDDPMIWQRLRQAASAAATRIPRKVVAIAKCRFMSSLPLKLLNALPELALRCDVSLRIGNNGCERRRTGPGWPRSATIKSLSSRGFHFGCPNWHRYTPKPAKYGEILSSNCLSDLSVVMKLPHDGA